MFYEGTRDGHGALFYPDGSVFKGLWVKGDLKGVGILKRPNRDICLGLFDENQFNKPALRDGPA